MLDMLGPYINPIWGIGTDGTILAERRKRGQSCLTLLMYAAAESRPLRARAGRF